MRRSGEADIIAAGERESQGEHGEAVVVASSPIRTASTEGERALAPRRGPPALWAMNATNGVLAMVAESAMRADVDRVAAAAGVGRWYMFRTPRAGKPGPEHRQCCSTLLGLALCRTRSAPPQPHHPAQPHRTAGRRLGSSDRHRRPARHDVARRRSANSSRRCLRPRSPAVMTRARCDRRRDGRSRRGRVLAVRDRPCTCGAERSACRCRPLERRHRSGGWQRRAARTALARPRIGAREDRLRSIAPSAAAAGWAQRAVKRAGRQRHRARTVGRNSRGRAPGRCNRSVRFAAPPDTRSRNRHGRSRFSRVGHNGRRAGLRRVHRGQIGAVCDQS